MSRFNADKHSEPILAAADRWRQQALEDNGSVFSDHALWQIENLSAIQQYFVNQPDPGEGNFFEKLEKQLEPTANDVKMLAAEMLWLMFLCPSNISAAKKREGVKRIWSWSGAPLPENIPELSDEVLDGIGSAGTSFNTNRWRELAFFVRLMSAFKKLNVEERTRLLSDGWAFGQWLERIPEGNTRQLRHMLLYLLFPDEFERIFGGTDRREIVHAFTGKPKREINAMSALDIDRALHKIRLEQEQAFETKELDFYWEPLKGLWTQRGFEKHTRGITREHVLDALKEIDRDGIPPDAQSSTYDLIHGENRYPPKLVLSVASKYASGTEFDRNLFSGGEASPAFRLLRNLGFHIERKDFVETLINQFIQQADAADDLSTSKYPRSYRGLNVGVSFGKGNFARIPWISFTGYGQKTTRGIYPGFLYYKSQGVLLLTYGLSEENPPDIQWPGATEKQTISDFFAAHYDAQPERYGPSFVFVAYKVPDEVDAARLTRDLDRIITEYQSFMESLSPPEVAAPITVEEPEVEVYPEQPPATPYSVGDALKGLFITPERFQAILSLLKAKKNMILQGPVLPENAYRLIFLIFFGEVANLEFPAIMVPK